MTSARVRALGVSVGLTLAVWLIFTWPLPRYPLDGIPSSSQNQELDGVRTMIRGDHLQLLYYYDLVRGMIGGEVPLLHDVYQFNTGDDADRFWPYAYFVPFSLIYAAAASVGGQAIGMQVTGILSLWLTLVLTVGLLRRFGVRGPAAWLAALPAVTLPFRWFMHLGGSPGGFALMYIPWIVWGLDVAIRDRRWTGGLTAGIGLLLLCWGDIQVFAVTGVSLPFWCLLSWVDSGRSVRAFPSEIPGWLRALAPMFVLIAVAFLYRHLLQGFLAGSDVSQGRSWSEIAGFSPVWQGLFAWREFGKNNHIFLGFVTVLVLAGGVVGGCVRPRNRLVFGLLAAALVGLILLSLGPHGPAGGYLFRGVRKVLPGFDMIRQPARVFFGPLPTLIALTCGLIVTRLPRRWPAAAVACLVLLVSAEHAVQVRATVCLLEPEQAAYAEIVADAGGKQGRPHLLAVPLWPGGSEWTSANLYHASRYGIRMLNGYSPVVSNDYFENVFRRFESVNQGVLDDSQINDLLERGIRYLVLHEDAFPDKVSPFPVVTTLCRFLDHPRLSLLRQEGPVWAFRLLEEPRPESVKPLRRYSFFPARILEFEHQSDRLDRTPREDVGASGRQFLSLSERGDWVKTRPLRVAPVSRLRWELRVRGQGTLRVVHRADDRAFAHQALEVASEDWTWLPVFLDDLPGFAPVSLALYWEDGSVDADVAYLTAGRWPPFRIDQPRTLPATAFFRAGYSDLEQGRVHFRRDFDPDDAILYGPLLPVEPGRFRVELLFAADTIPDIPLGEIRAGFPGTMESLFAVVTGRPAAGELTVESNLPLRLEFHYTRAADMVVREIRLARLPDDPDPVSEDPDRPFAED